MRIFIATTYLRKSLNNEKYEVTSFHKSTINQIYRAVKTKSMWGKKNITIRQETYFILVLSVMGFDMKNKM